VENVRGEKQKTGRYDLIRRNVGGRKTQSFGDLEGIAKKGTHLPPYSNSQKKKKKKETAALGKRGGGGDPRPVTKGESASHLPTGKKEAKREKGVKPYVHASISQA